MIAAEASVRALVAEANQIYSQVGVVLDLGDRITVTNIPAAYNVLWEGSTNTMWNFDQLVDVATNTGGLELYFVNRIVKNSAGGGSAGRTTIGGHSGSGIVIAGDGVGVTLAHEIGHAFGMSDVYRVDSGECLFPGRTRFDFQPQDWNNGCLAVGNGCERYYTTGTLHHLIIKSMLMDGYKYESPSYGVDITYGPVSGFGVGGVAGDAETGYFQNFRHVDEPVSK